MVGRAGRAERCPAMSTGAPGGRPANKVFARTVCLHLATGANGLGVALIALGDGDINAARATIVLHLLHNV